MAQRLQPNMVFKFRWNYYYYYYFFFSFDPHDDSAFNHRAKKRKDEKKLWIALYTQKKLYFYVALSNQSLFNVKNIYRLVL